MTGLREKQRVLRQNIILEVSRQLLRSLDYHTVTIEMIALKAELSQMTVYNYFGSKGGLLLALVNQSDQLLVEKISKHINSNHTDPFESIKKFSFIVIEHAFSYLDRKTWRHVHSTAILEGHSTFGLGFLKLEKELVQLMCELVITLESRKMIKLNDDAMTVANIFYNVHNARFIEFASDNSISRKQIKKLISSDFKCLTHLIIQRAAN